MTSASDLRSGKTHRDENFPVASWIIHPRHRALILSYYNFVRTADDIADHATLSAMRNCGISTCSKPIAGQGRHAEGSGQSSAGPGRARDGAEACARRAGRFPHGRYQAALRELGRGHQLLPLFGHAGRTLHARRSWREHLDLGRVRRALRGPAINNHLQDCAKDYKNLNRIYLPRDALAASGASVEMLGEAKSPPQLLQCLHALAVRTETLLNESRSLSAEVKDFRLGLRWP